jgi:hypothetical protein
LFLPESGYSFHQPSPVSLHPQLQSDDSDELR